MKDIFEFVAIITKFDELHNEKRIDTDFFFLYHLVTKEWVPNNFVILNTVKDLGASVCQEILRFAQED